jgi:hypothetical protein
MLLHMLRQMWPSVSIAFHGADGTFGTLAGAFAPAIFGAIIGSGSREALFGAYCFAGALMIVAAIVEAFLGVKAERQSLESIATPLSEVLQPAPAT